MSARVTDEDYVSWKGWTSPFGTVTPEDDAYFSRELARCRIPPLAGLEIVELGFGNGSFAGWARAQGARWIGIEQNSLLVERARAATFEASSFELASVVTPGSVDLIVAFDVLEHLELPAIRAFLSTARTVLRSGGLVLGRIPSGDSPFSSSIFRGDLTHRTLLGSSALRQLASECKLETVVVRDTAFPILGLGAKRAARRLAVASARTIAYALVRNVLIGEPTAVMSPNMTFVLRNH